VGLAVLILLTFLIIVLVGSPYLTWDYSDPETAVMGTFIHAFEFVFVRLSPFLLIGLIAGAILTRKQ
jgi:putative transcriptional regulator